MNRIARIAAIALTGSLLATSVLAGGGGGVGGTGIGQLPEIGKPKPKGGGMFDLPIEVPQTNNKPKPGKNNPFEVPIDPDLLPDEPDDNNPFDVPIDIGSGPSAPGASANNNGGGSSAAPKLTPSQTRALKLGCVVAGTPLENPNDIWLTNLTKTVLPAGLKIRFTVKADGQSGILALPQPIEPGQQLLLADIIDPAAAGADCTAKAMA